ncbi:xanthine dehydrogenase accessory protein XdhC, partial [Escherichia coli]|uniref:XdhC family protein n=1 Tax=Escherichia coli TaxID=562 RepID=UPI0019863948
MEAWLGDLQQLLAHGEAAVLVTVAHTDGSAPREAGTKMLVTRDTARYTIGGGHLEWKAIE